MIIELNASATEKIIREFSKSENAITLLANNKTYLISSSSQKSYNTEFIKFVAQIWTFDNDIQLASKTFDATKKAIRVGEIEIGGNSQSTILIAGPCSVESEEQLFSVADYLHASGAKFIRGGCFKPRTSPYSFQGLEEEGLKLLEKVRSKYGLAIVTEIKDASHADLVIDYTDIIQIGAKAMYDQGILKKCAKSGKPVLLKRGFGSTLQEFVQSAEFMLSGGNPNVILCERGIRTFENKTRFTLDLCGVAYLKEFCNLPILLDPSHAMGHAYGVADLSRACIAMGVDGLMLEVHPDPTQALSDAAQQLSIEDYKQLVKSLKPVATAVGKHLIG